MKLKWLNKALGGCECGVFEPRLYNFIVVDKEYPPLQKHSTFYSKLYVLNKFWMNIVASACIQLGRLKESKLLKPHPF
jgi:hypothetical protein